ncbi:MAG: AsmA-like C-terminal region-containing protein, partial [Krumholzibacteria bacterium]|nr:AsmA-like C-terminal region-containing protein [Candidatus Krumholzibacteria bacterium]
DAPPAALDYLAKLVGSADVRIGTLVVRQNSLTDVRGTARLDRGRITLDETSAAVYGGTGRLSGTVDLTDPRAGRLDLQLVLSDARAERYFAAATVPGRFTRLANALNGGLDATVSLQGALDDTLGLDLRTLTSVGEVALRDARLTGLPLQAQLVSLLDAPQLDTMTFKDLLQPFRIENGRLTVDKLEVQAGPIGIRASGWQNLAGELSAHLDLTLPPEYAQGLRRQLPAQMADLLLDAQGTALELPVAVSGTADAPSVRLDTDGLATLARSRAEAKLSRETDKLKQQAIEEASRNLQDLLKAPTDSAAAGADSTGPQTLEDVGKSLLDRLKKKGGGG